MAAKTHPVDSVYINWFALFYGTINNGNVITKMAATYGVTFKKWCAPGIVTRHLCAPSFLN